MGAVIRIPGPLRRITDNQDKVTVEDGSLAATIETLESRFPGIQDRLLDENGNLRHFVNIYVNGEDVQFLDNLETVIKDGDEVSIVPAVAGGQR
ncbi:MAG: MoaD/ThiS family protein [SAR202 cluster bacterium]|nr:MoaD/ThiS family protein [SAR202 cluster bacterium]